MSDLRFHNSRIFPLREPLLSFFLLLKISDRIDPTKVLLKMKQATGNRSRCCWPEKEMGKDSNNTRRREDKVLY
jgi:hypothetical protein